MFELCLFDLDQTLVDTDDLRELREAGRNNNDPEYIAELEHAFEERFDRLIYEIETLEQIRNRFQDLKLGVFTRAPRSYAMCVLEMAYPDFDWDILVAFEDVAHTKPYGDGIVRAAECFGITQADRVLVVGDNEMDIRSAYNAGCLAVLDRSAWPQYNLGYERWNALKLVPDAMIRNPNELFGVLDGYEGYLPDLERRMCGARACVGAPRFDPVNKFIPRELGGDTTAYPVFACGRSFSAYPSLEFRRAWHGLTQSIQAHKEAEIFPDEWIESIKAFISDHFPGPCFIGGNLAVTVIPHRPGRAPRLEQFLAQLQNSFVGAAAIGKLRLHFHPELLGYRDGVRSHSRDHLGAMDRFRNVRDNLYVRQEDVVAQVQQVLVIDDVSTTGATLIYANKYLQEAGIRVVTTLTIAMNISNVLYD